MKMYETNFFGKTDFFFLCNLERNNILTRIELFIDIKHF